MKDPALAVQKAVVAALRANAAVSAIVGARVFDQPPQGAEFPYVELGDIQTIGRPTDRLLPSEVYVTLHTWSRAVGKVETRRVMGAIRDALDEAALALEGHALDVLQYETGHATDDPDGLTKHGVMTFRALTHALR